MGFLMALAATAVSQVDDQILSTNEDCLLSPSCSEPSGNCKNEIETKETKQLQLDFPTDVGEEKQDTEVEEEKPPILNPQFDKPLHVDVGDDFQDNFSEETSNIQRRLFTQTSYNMNQVDNQAFYGHPVQGQSIPHQEYGVFMGYGSPERDISQLKIDDFPRQYPTHFIVPKQNTNLLFKSPVNGPRHAWPPEHIQQFQNETGYNSDNDALSRARSRSKRASLENPTTNQGNNSFEKGHRRHRSGDFLSSAYPSNLQNEPNTNQFAFNTNFNDANRTSLQHSQSSGSINNPFAEHRERVPMNHSMSVDATSKIQDHLCLQTTSFVNLQAAISSAAKQYEILETQVDAKNRQLNAGLNVRQNPTQSDCEQLDEEILCLTKEIQDMYNEFDNMGVPVPGDSPQRVMQRPLSEPNPRTPYRPVSPYIIGSVTTTTQPRQVPPPRPPPYNNHKYAMEPVRYENVINYKMKSDSLADDLNRQTPPPIPPRQPTSEKWTCPECTFINLLVAECEVCLNPRPTTLR